MQKKYIVFLFFLIDPGFLQSMESLEFPSPPPEELFPDILGIPDAEKSPEPITQKIIQGDSNPIGAKKNLILTQVPYKDKTVIKFSLKKSLECKSCNKILASRNSFRSHLKSRIHKNNLISESSTEWDEKTGSPSGVSPSEKVADNNNTITMVAKGLVLAKIQPKNENILKFDLKTNVHVCTVCCHTFSSQISLNNHRREHRLAHRCTLCNRQYISEVRLNKHLTEKHEL